MNTQKKKSKNRPNKTLNPLPPQTVEISENVGTISAGNKLEDPVNTEERVPEIISEVVPTPAGTKEDAEHAVPQKPKRNRGKKKKGDKTESCDTTERKPSSTELTEDNKLSTNLTDEKYIQDPQKIAENVTLVAPTSRKKKGKNKSQINVEKFSEPEVKSDITETKNDVKIEIQEESILLTEAQETEIKCSKKKNKKNKKSRSDTEKVDDSFGDMGFQKNIQETDIKNKNEGTTKVAKCADKLLDDPTCNKYIETKLHDIDKQTDESSKSKKKNKKDEKFLPEEDEAADDKLTPTQLFNISHDIKPMTFVMELPEERDKIIEIREEDSDIVIANADVIDNTTTPLVPEPSPKAKAKIAKPVEKKTKDKKPEALTEQQELVVETIPKDKDTQIKSKTPEEDDEDLVMFAITDESPEDEFFQVTMNNDERKSSNIDLTKETETREEQKSTTPSEIIDITKPEKVCQETRRKIIEEQLNISLKSVKTDEAFLTNKGGAKLKDKGGKKSKQSMSKIEKQDVMEQKESEISLPCISDVAKTCESSKEASVVSRDPSETGDTKHVLESIDEKLPKKESIVIPLPYFAIDAKPEKSIPLMPGQEATSFSEVISHSENDNSKKGKKSPKPAKKPDASTKDSTKESSNIFDENKGFKSVELNVGITMTSGAKLLNIDESKVITKSVGITSPDKSNITQIQSSPQTPDINPDIIESPRSSSADVIDDNNNAIIQEINSPSTLTVPIFIPETQIITSSGDSPEIMPHGNKYGIKKEVKDIVTPTKNIEKTDVKSKMMEVNQDMEDLRLSIEKSLAELTALEKKDDEFVIKSRETILHEAGTKKESLHSLTPIQETEIHFKIPLDLDKDKNALDKMFCKDNLRKESAEANKETSALEECSTTKTSNVASLDAQPPVCPSRKDNKGKNKSKKKDKQASSLTTTTANSDSTAATAQSEIVDQKAKKEGKSESKGEQQSHDTKGKQQSGSTVQAENPETSSKTDTQFDPIENFEDAMTSSADDVNKSFEIIANEASNGIVTEEKKSNPVINVIDTDNVDKDKDKESNNEQDKIKPIVSQPKNLLGHPAIPVRSSKMDYKKEKNKTLNLKQAKVKIKDANELEKSKASKESQTENKPKSTYNKGFNESVMCVTSDNDEYIYKYSFRKVFLSSNCHICKKDLKENRVTCSFCNLLFYCSEKHMEEDFPQHQAFCFAVSTIFQLKGQKHIYAETRGITGHDYRLLRMQQIVSCERILKRKLMPSEQEALLYPRLCADGSCREWRNELLQDCLGCGQISYCSAHQEHMPKSHGRWCRSYALYRKLVVHQLTRGRLEPRLPTKVLSSERITDNINRLLADMYDERIDMNDIQYAALTQLATAPLTAAFSYQLYSDKMKSIQANGTHKRPTFTIHVVGAELQFEADSLNKWEVFFLHLRPELLELRVTLVGPELNPSNLPLGLLANIKLCPTCRVDRRRVVFQFQDKCMYHQYRDSDDFVYPDLVCAFNPSIHRSASYSQWSWTPILNSILKLKTPFCVTSYSMSELQRDLIYIKDHAQAEFNTVSEAKFNPFASVRPDRNFITDDEIPLLFKNYCYGVLIGAL